MGENEGWSEVPGGVVLPNGLLPNASPVLQVLDLERWSKAEERTSQLIECIQPNSPSEERRNAVADYVQRLIMKCFPCQVFTFGSVPLKTYLPDGDIDLTAFSNSQTLKDTWANQVRDVLEDEEKNENAEFQVKEVQYIQAEVKLIKCLVENIVVDISFNQLGGLCTLCFLEEVDHLISQNHLFKRSIILIKAWCYYESRVLGAHHGLISTYALETLVLYIFHVFNNSFAGPLEVLYRFLEFFSNFDWDNFCVSLWGPVPITSLPDVIAEPPRKDCGELLLSKLFLDACSSVYAVLPGQENQGQPFVSKYFNVIDPLRINNNLGRSVGKGNFFRIRSAFAFGAKKLARLLDCPTENMVYEVNQFFTNTWERHGSGNRPDAPITDLPSSRFSTPHGYDSLSNGLIAKKVNKNISDRDTEVDKSHTRKSPSQHGNYPSEKIPTPQTQKLYGSLNSSRVFDQAIRASNPKLLVNDIPGRLIFARTRSSPDLTDISVGLSPQERRNKAPESGKNQAISTRIENNNPSQNNRNWKKGNSQNNKQHGSENLESYGARSSGSDHSPIRNIPTNETLDAVKLNSSLNSINVQRMDEEEQDLVNMMASTNFHGFNGQQLHMPMNLPSGHLPFPISPSILASMGYGHRNFSGMVPPNFHFIDPSLSQMHFPQGLIPPQLAQYFPGNFENTNEPNNQKITVLEMNPEECNNHDLLHEQDNRNYEMLQLNEKPEPSSIPLKYVPTSRKNQKNVTKERPIRENHLYQENGNDYPDDKSTASRLSSAGRSSSLRSRTSSESSWDGSSTKVSRTMKEKRGKKSAHADPSSSYEKVKNVNEHNIQPIENDEVWDADEAVPHGYELAQSSESETMMNMGPVLLNHGSRQSANDNSRVLFYPTGPPVPFLTMLPFNYAPPETRNPEVASTHFNGEQGTDSSDQRVKPDILHSDFASHYQNLLFGRFCQSPRSHGGSPVGGYPQQPVVVPPMYVQGRVPFDGPGRPNMNVFSQLIGGYGPRLVPVGPFQSGSNRPPPVYQHYVEEIPRPRSGTGTYLPNLQNVSPRERNPSGPRRGSYNYDRSDSHAESERNWNNTKSRGRNNTRNQNEKNNSRVDRSNSNDSRTDRPWNSNRRDSPSSSSYQGYNSHLRSSTSQSAAPPPSMVYSMYPAQGMSPNGVSSSGPVMVYPLDHNANYDMHPEQFAFGSFGPGNFSNSTEQRQDFDEQRIHGERSSPDQPSSPHF